MIKIEITDTEIPGGICVLLKTVKFMGIPIIRKKKIYFKK
jgi:hypothetical protein